MDYNKIISAFVAIAAIASSCAKEENPVEKGQLKVITFVAGNESIDPASDTKTYINDWTSREQFWSKGDAISVFANGNLYEFTNSSEDGTTASFVGEAEEATSYTTLYPYQSTASCASGKITAVFPATQTVDAHGTDPAALLSVATSGGSNLNFKNVFGIVKFTITETDVTSILIEGNNGEILAGTIEITPGKTPSWTAVKGETTIVINSADGNAFAAGDYAIAVLPQTFEKGFKLILKKTGSAKCSIKSLSTSTDIVRSAGVSVPSTLFVTPAYKYYYILTKDDLLSWNSDGGNWTSTDVVYLGADINFGKATFQKSGDTFSGTFDGRYHRIYNIKGTGSNKRAGMFHQVTGTVKNLCVGSSDYDFSKGNAADAGTYDGYSYFRITGCTATDWYYSGLVAYLHTNGVLDNVVNFCTTGCTVTSSTHKTSNQRAGGVAGTMKGGATIKNCTNYGTVEFTSTNIKTGLNDIGGIVSRSDGEGASVINCVNHGYVHNLSPEIRNIGGIIGAAGYAMTLDNCQNYGTVTNDANAGSAFSTCIGGVIGYSNKTISKKTKLQNFGKITNNGTGTNYMYIGGIIGNCSSAAHSLTSAQNTGDIINNSKMDCEIYMGGILGCNSYGSTFKTLSNSGKIINNGNCSKGLWMGGIIGWTGGDNTFTGNTNTGDIVNYGTVSESLYSGGIIGQIQNASNLTGAQVTNCTISNSGTVTGSLMLGGVVGYGSKGKDSRTVTLSSSTVSESVNIENSGAASDIYLGGILGYHKFLSGTTIFASKYENDIVKAEISNLEGGDATTGVISIGGIVGYAESTVPTSFKGHKSSASISNAGTAATDVNLGGIIGGASVDWTITSCEVNSVLTNTSESTGNYGMILGIMPVPSVTKCGVAGTNNGTVLTDVNWSANLCGSTTDPSGVITDGSENSCYFLAPNE